MTLVFVTYVGANTQTYIRANDLYQSLGIKINMLTGRRSGPYPAPLDPSQIDVELNEIKTQAFNVTVSIEAPNEYDISHGSDTDWVGKIKNYTFTLYSKVKADEILKNLPVIGPSLTSVDSYKTVGDSDQFIDDVNLHLYQANRWPGNNGGAVMDMVALHGLLTILLDINHRLWETYSSY